VKTKLSLISAAILAGALVALAGCGPSEPPPKDSQIVDADQAIPAPGQQDVHGGEGGSEMTDINADQ
jgi:predicted small lipoprotein YifL